MKKKLGFSLLGFGVLFMLSQRPHEVLGNLSFGGGSGTASDPYLISTPEHLIELNEAVNVRKINTSSVYFQLTDNIDFSGYDTDEDETNGNWTPLGTSTTPFKGTFDGQGHTISNIEILLPDQIFVGFFGDTSSATIQNLGLENVMIEGNRCVGGLVSYQNNGVINHSYATGNVTGNDRVGGLVGYQSKGTITQSYATGNATGNDYVGGLVGYLSSGTITQSYATGEVNGSNDYVGGLVGNQNAGTITQSYATGNATGNEYVGGLVGYQGSSGTITQSYATGSVKGSYSGGLVGSQSSGTISQSYAIGTVTGSYSGGLSGKHSAGSVSNSYWDIESSGQSSSQGGIGLTTKEMTKANALTHMTGFDFETVWRKGSQYPELQWQPEVPITEEEIDLTINGTIKETILSLTIPSQSITFVLNPNEEEEQQFIASEFSLINESRTPLTLELKTFEQTTDVLNDVTPTKYSDWSNLNKKESKDFALALTPKVGEGWLSLNEGDRWIVDLGNTEIGTMKGNATVSFEFKAKHGSAFSEILTPQYRLTFIFGLQD